MSNQPRTSHYIDLMLILAFMLTITHNATIYNILTHLNPFTVSSVQQLSISLLGGWTLRFGLQGVVTLGTSGSVASFSEVWSSRSLVVSPTCAVLSGCSSHCWLDTCGLRSTRFLLRDAPCSVWIWYERGATSLWHLEHARISSVTWSRILTCFPGFRSHKCLALLSCFCFCFWFSFIFATLTLCAPLGVSRSSSIDRLVRMRRPISIRAGHRPFCNGTLL